MSGTLALVGGGEFGSDCGFDAELLSIAQASEVLIVPTGAAYEHPERAVAQAASHFESLGAKARGLMVLNRHDALDDANGAEARSARFVYITGGSPMHLRSVLKATPVWEGLLEAWRNGAVIAGSSAGAMALCDPMVDPRGGAFTLGLGLLEQVAVIPHHDQWSHERSRRTFELAGIVVSDRRGGRADRGDPWRRWHLARRRPSARCRSCSTAMRSASTACRSLRAAQCAARVREVPIAERSEPAPIEAERRAAPDYDSVIVTFWICTGWEGGPSVPGTASAAIVLIVVSRPSVT